MTDKQPITEDDIHVRQDNYDNSNWSVVIDVNSQDASLALKLKQQVLDGQKVLEGLKLLKIDADNIGTISLLECCEDIVKLTRENQKLKEEIQMLEQSWTPLNEEYENLKAENEELKYKFEASKKAYTEEEKELRELKDRHNDCIPILLERDVIQQENQKLKETIARLDSEKSHIIILYGNLKLEIEELKGVKNAVNLAVDFLDLKSKYKIVQQESKQSKEIVKRLEEKYNKTLEKVNDGWQTLEPELKLLQSILKGEKI